MSTYTDLHNRIKENLTILRRPGSKSDGMSPQKVILINPENQFYGTFNGKMNITGGILSGLTIVDSELSGVELAGATVDGESLSELKTMVETNTQAIELLSVNMLSGVALSVDNWIEDVGNLINHVSSEVFTSATVYTDGRIDNLSATTSNLVAVEIQGLGGDIQDLSTRLSSVISSLTSRLSNALEVLDGDPLSGLNENSKISTVIHAVLEIRSALSSLRAALVF